MYTNASLYRNGFFQQVATGQVVEPFMETVKADGEGGGCHLNISFSQIPTYIGGPINTHR